MSNSIDHEVQEEFGPMPSRLFDTAGKVESFFAAATRRGDHVDILVGKPVARTCEAGQRLILQGQVIGKKSVFERVIDRLGLHSLPRPFRKVRVQKG